MKKLFIFIFGLFSILSISQTQTFNGVKTFTSAPVFQTLTAGRIPFSGTGSVFSDSSRLLWNNTSSYFEINGNTYGLRLKETLNNSYVDIVNSGFGSSSLVFKSNYGSGKTLMTLLNPTGTNAAQLAIGDVISVPAESQLYLYGGNNGANMDLRGKTTRDEANMDFEGSDWASSPNSLGFSYFGPNYDIGGTIMGYPKIKTGVVRFNNAENALIVSNNGVDVTPIRFGINDSEVLNIDNEGMKLLAGKGITSEWEFGNMLLSGDYNGQGNERQFQFLSGGNGVDIGTESIVQITANPETGIGFHSQTNSTTSGDLNLFSDTLNFSSVSGSNSSSFTVSAIDNNFASISSHISGGIQGVQHTFSQNESSTYQFFVNDAGGGDYKQVITQQKTIGDKQENRYTIEDISSSITDSDLTHLTDSYGSVYYYDDNVNSSVFGVGSTYSTGASRYSVSIGDSNSNGNGTSIQVDDNNEFIDLRTNSGVGFANTSSGRVIITPADATTDRQQRLADRDGVISLDNEVIRTITATTNLISSDKHIDVSSGTFTIPFNVSATSSTVYGKEFIITNSGSGIVTLDANGTETIGGKLTYVVPAESGLEFRSNGTNWILTNRFKQENFNRTQWSQNISTTAIADATSLNLLTLIPNASKVANGTDGGINELNIASNSILIPWRGTPMTHQIRLTGTLATGTDQHYGITLRRTADNSIISSYEINRNADVGLFTVDFVTYTGSSSDPFVTGGFYLSFDNNSGASVDLTTNLNLFITSNFK